MHPDFQRLMNDATRLVRGGDLQAATAAIQAALHGQPAGAAAADREPSPHDMVIDVDAREVDAPLLQDHRVTPEEPQHAAPCAQGAGTFVAGRFSDGRMQRDYKLYVPPQAGHRPLPLLVMLHGCTQDPDDFAAGTQMNEAARAQGCFVLYPAQSQQANPQRCWNWFKHSHQQRGRGEPALLAAMTRDVIARHGIDPARVYVAGLSAGGAMGSAMVVALSSDDPHRAAAAAALSQVTYPQAWDATGQLDRALGGIRVVPTTVLMERDGRLLFRQEGALTIGELQALAQAYGVASDSDLPLSRVGRPMPSNP